MGRKKREMKGRSASHLVEEDEKKAERGDWSRGTAIKSRLCSSSSSSAASTSSSRYPESFLSTFRWCALTEREREISVVPYCLLLRACVAVVWTVCYLLTFRFGIFAAFAPSRADFARDFVQLEGSATQRMGSLDDLVVDLPHHYHPC